jgi:hypothetical protein
VTSHATAAYVHCPRAADLALRAWSDGVVVYDDANASLHALTPVAGEALQLLINGVAGDATCLAHALLQDTPDEEEITMVSKLIIDLESMGFVQRVPG